MSCLDFVGLANFLEPCDFFATWNLFMEPATGLVSATQPTYNHVFQVSK